MKRLKKDLEKILKTRIRMTLYGRICYDVPLEAFYHLQNFLGGAIPIDYDLTEIAKRKGIIK